MPVSFILFLDQNNTEQLTAVDIIVLGSPALDALGRLLRGLCLQALADITEAAVVHRPLERIILPPKSFSHVSLRKSPKNKQNDKGSLTHSLHAANSHA